MAKSRSRSRTRSRSRSRRRSRITPRRWLPFLALLAVVATAVVLVRRGEPDVGATRSVPAPGAVIPVAAGPDALSTAWYCSGGSARGTKGPAELEAFISSARPTGTTADIVVVGDNGTTKRDTVDVPAYGRTRIVAADYVSADWAAMTIEVLGGNVAVEQQVTGKHGFDATPCPTTAGAEWFVPSGSTAIGAEQYLLVYNPFPGAANVDIDFATDKGPFTPRALRGFSLAPGALRLVPVESQPARRDQIATRVKARSGQVVVDRVQIYDGTGAATKATDDTGALPAPRGLASTPAIPAPSTRWVFPAAVNADGVRNQVALYNPSTTTAAEVDLLLGYEDPSRQGDIEPVQATVQPGEQQLVDLRSVPGLDPHKPYSIAVDSFAADGHEAVPVVAEQLVFNSVEPAGQNTSESEPPPDDDGSGGEAPPEAPPAAEPALGFSTVAGSPVTASRWILADIGAGENRRAQVVVLNPGGSAVELEVVAYKGGTRTPVRTGSVRVAAHDRRVLDLTGVKPYSVLTVTSSNGQVVVARTSQATTGVGLLVALGSPLPDTVHTLPPLR